MTPSRSKPLNTLCRYSLSRSIGAPTTTGRMGPRRWTGQDIATLWPKRRNQEFLALSRQTAHGNRASSSTWYRTTTPPTRPPESQSCSPRIPGSHRHDVRGPAQPRRGPVRDRFFHHRPRRKDPPVHHRLDRYHRSVLTKAEQILAQAKPQIPSDPRT